MRAYNQTEIDGLLVPCGKCLSCRKAKNREWSMRLIHELDSHDYYSFVTLTYSDEHMPDYGSLKKSDLQKFFKRLRKSVPGLKIKYYAVGEYGDTTERPHYHIILFGLGLMPRHRQYVIDAWPYCDWTVKSILEKSFGMVEPKSINYVTQYLNKKLSGEAAEQAYNERYREPVFKVSSNGLGLEYAIKNSVQIKDNLYLTLNGAKLAIPRYYIDKLGIDVTNIKELAIERSKKEMSEFNTDGLSYDDAYKVLTAPEVLAIEGTLKQRRRQRDMNLNAKLKLFNNSKI